MLKAYRTYINNFLISKYNLFKFKDLPIIFELKIYLRYKRKTIYLILTTFFLLYSLSSYKPKLFTKQKNISKSVRKLIFFLKSEKIYLFLYKFIFFFWKYNTTCKSFLNSTKNIRIFFYNLQVLYLEFFFLKLQNATWANFNFKLEFLFKLLNIKEINPFLLKNFFQAHKLLKVKKK